MATITKLSADWVVPAAIAVGSLTYAYFHNDKELSDRITKVEATQTVQHAADDQRLQRIERQVDRLVEWAYGSK